MEGVSEFSGVNGLGGLSSGDPYVTWRCRGDSAGVVFFLFTWGNISSKKKRQLVSVLLFF